MHVLVLTTSYPMTTNPGSGVFIRRMLDHLPKDIRVSVLTPDDDHCGRRWPAPGHMAIKTFGYAPRPWQTVAHQPGGIPTALRHKPWHLTLIPLFSLSMLWATLIQARKVDLIHANWSFSGLVAGIAGKLSGTPVVTTLRGTDIQWAQQGLVFRGLLKGCVRLSRRVVTVSQTMADQVARWFPEEHHKVLTIPNGVGARFWSLLPKPGEEFTVAVIGNLTPLKQVDVVIRAFGRLVTAHAHARLIVIGDGPERPRLERMVQCMGLRAQVVFRGHLTPAQVAGQLACCNVVVHASAGEGRPNVVLEAMAAGLPVIAADIKAVRELIVPGQRGLLFAVGDGIQLTDHMQTLLANPALGAQLAANARQWLQSRGLTWQNTAARYAALFRNVSAQHRQRKQPCVV